VNVQDDSEDLTAELLPELIEFNTSVDINSSSPTSPTSSSTRRAARGNHFRSPRQRGIVFDSSDLPDPKEKSSS